MWRKRTANRRPIPSVARKLQFHLLSFEGPDPYSRAGGLATRVTGLGEALAAAGLETHLWFVGDPGLPGHEESRGVWLHRWCQWISRHHPGGVYEGEHGKQPEFSASLPPFLLQEHLLPALQHGASPVVLAEEWHTVDAVLHLDWLLRRAGVRDRVAILWNANNVFGFERIDWQRLKSAATITTVSRYMRHELWRQGVDPLVIPNGIPVDALAPPANGLVRAVRRSLLDRLVLSKIGRWDPDKRWLLAIDTIADLKRRGLRPLLVARGGVEPHGLEVRARAAAHGLVVVERNPAGSDGTALARCLAGLEAADIALLDSPLNPDALRLLYRGSTAVLANSGREPFGLVGLEAMASESVTCVGGTGEEYVVPGWNALVLQTEDPREFLNQFEPLAADPRRVQALRRHAVETARRFIWPEVIHRNLLPRISLVRDTEPSGPDSALLDNLGGPPKPRLLPLELSSHPPPTKPRGVFGRRKE
jgi:glycosyltransferase involved in cell wall biosynthesis